MRHNVKKPELEPLWKFGCYSKLKRGGLVPAVLRTVSVTPLN